MPNIGEIAGSFDEVDDETKELIMRIVSNFHLRDAVLHEDGSMGTIQISPKQLRDCIAFISRCLTQTCKSC